MKPEMGKNGLVVCTSGGFDPVHIGHISLFNAAKQLAGEGGKHIVILNGDGWLRRKKGKAFMPAEERREILRNLASVDDVIIWDDGRDDVSLALEKIKPDIFANGGDRIHENTPEVAVCKKFGIKMEFNIGGEKMRSSSELLRRYGENDSLA